MVVLVGGVGGYTGGEPGDKRESEREDKRNEGGRISARESDCVFLGFFFTDDEGVRVRVGECVAASECTRAFSASGEQQRGSVCVCVWEEKGWGVRLLFTGETVGG